MRKFIGVLLSVLCICCAAIGLTGCKKDKHIHAFDKQVITDEYKATDATCTEKATYYYSCSCGEKGAETFEYGSITNHNFVNGRCTYCGKEQEESSLAFTLLNDETYEVSGIGSCTDTEIVIPSVYNNKPVTSIGNSAFSDCSGLTSIIIPESVTSIGNWAFSDCSGLTSITIPESVTSIGHFAFSDCYKLVEVINKSGLNITKGSSNNGEIAYYALNVKEDGTSDIVNKGGYLFYTYDNVNYLLAYVGSNTDLTLPADYNGQNYEIYNYAFEGCSGLTSITIPESVTSIGERAFSYCYKLVEVINKSGLNITKGSSNNGDIAYYALNVKEDGASDIVNKDGYLFYTVEGTHYLVSYVGNDVILTLPESYNGKSYEINRYAFCYYYNIVSVTIPESVTAIGDSAFEMCYKLVEVINKSALNIEKGSEDNGYVGCYALNIKTSGETDIVNKYDYLFYTEDNVNYLVNYTGNETNLTLPRNFNGYKYKIHNFAFCVCIYVESVTIPDSVTFIGDYAFAYCSGLTSITIPDSVTSIGSWAFGCSGLTSVTIPDNVNSIGSWAFCDCRQLKEIVWNAENCTIEDPYEPPYQYSIFGGGTNLINIIIGENVKSIPNCAFRDSGLKNIYYTGPIANWCTISGLGNIMSWSITLYINGKKVNGDLVIPDSVTSIGDGAFEYCSGLTSITIPDSVTTIGSSAFYNCSGLTSITIGGSVTSIGDGAFDGCSSLTSVIIPDSVTSIGNSAFRYCSGLTSITIPDSVTSIVNYAFYNCSGLSSITIPESVTSIGDEAFGYCSGLTSITIPESVTSIGDGAFYGCSGLTSITIPESVTSIGDGAFSGCSGLTSITIPDSVTSIGNGAFYNCKGLTSITIPESVTSIGDEAFYYCSGLTSITIPDSVTSIGERAFSYCYKLVEVINK
ncbi:MAG: leucine-rich repeat domain-containing protein, partial [Candidatus Borkfalkiaceae bacterium]|nr:leucine-rich repeat domain-containing protein [Christensenellaceae bacterium]